MKKKDKIVGGAAILIIGVIALIIGYLSNKDSGETYTDIFEAREQYDNNAYQGEDENSKQDGSQLYNATLNDGQDNDALVSGKHTEMIVVDIKGAVKNPREYSMEEGSRVRDIIEKAGGLTEEADEDRIHYSKLLEDEECIRIYKIGEDEEAYEDGGGSCESLEKSSSGKININKADLTELETLPGIGEVKARSIINYREANGKFSSVDELSNIDGIGEKTVAKLRDMVEVK